MNKNKKVVKAIFGVLCASMLMGGVAPVYASTNDTQTTSSNDTKEVEVTYNKSASYFVTIPKTITLGSNKESTYNVKVEGDIPSNRNVYVAPEDAISKTSEIDFYMHDQSTKNPKEDVVAIVTQNKDIWDFEDVVNGYEETNNKISATNLTAGNWKGTFDFNINLKDVHNHTYTSKVTKEPTCTEKGVKTFTCVDGDHSYTEEIPAIGHKYGEVTYTWDSDNSTCTAKRVCTIDGYENIEIVNSTNTITKAATCTGTGTKTYLATFKNNAFANQTSTTSIPALGHDRHTHSSECYTEVEEKEYCSGSIKKSLITKGDYAGKYSITCSNGHTEYVRADAAPYITHCNTLVSVKKNKLICEQDTKCKRCGQ